MLSYSAISLSMYVVLKSTYVDHSDYVPGFISTYVDTKKAILPKKKISRRREVFHLLLGRIHTLLYSSDRYREGHERIAVRSPAFTRETVDESLRGRSPLTRDPTIPERDFDQITDIAPPHSPSMGTFAYLCR